MQVRVKKELYGEDDQPITDPETGRQVCNHSSYFGGPGRKFFPGEAFELHDAEAEKELRPHPQGRLVILERADAHRDRLERISKRNTAARDAERADIEREMRALDAQAAASASMRRLAQDRDLAEMLRDRPGATTAAALRMMDQHLTGAGEREAAARAEVPDAVQQQLQAMAERMAALEAENKRLAAQAQRPRRERNNAEPQPDPAATEAKEAP